MINVEEIPTIGKNKVYNVDKNSVNYQQFRYIMIKMHKYGLNC